MRHRKSILGHNLLFAHFPGLGKSPSKRGDTGLNPAFIVLKAAGLMMVLLMGVFFSGCAGIDRREEPRTFDEIPEEFAPEKLPEYPEAEQWIFLEMDPDGVKTPWIYPAWWYGGHQAACSLTFDDGTLDQYLIAAPELEERGMRGTFFIITGFREDGVWLDGSKLRRLFSWDDARELVWRGHEVASHSAGHVDLYSRPEKAREEIESAYLDLKREIPWASRFSFGWPYWRSSSAVERIAEEFHHAARAGGVNAAPSSPRYGGVNDKSPENHMRIGAKGILSSEDGNVLMPILESVYSNGGWLIPNFHGIDDGNIDPSALGWEAVRIDAFREMLDTLREYDFWFAPFGSVARYVRQRNMLFLEARMFEGNQQVRYTSGLDPEIFNHHLTLIMDLPPDVRLRLVEQDGTGIPLPFTRRNISGKNRYLIDLPPGDGILSISFLKDTMEPTF